MTAHLEGSAAAFRLGNDVSIDFRGLYIERKDTPREMASCFGPDRQQTLRFSLPATRFPSGQRISQRQHSRATGLLTVEVIAMDSVPRHRMPTSAVTTAARIGASLSGSPCSAVT